MSPGARAALGRAGLALLAGMVAVVVVAGPGLGRLHGEVLGYLNDDSAGALALHDAWHRAVAEGRPVGRDPDQLAPVGAPLATLHGGNALEMALSGLFALFLPFPGWYSYGALAWIPLNTLAFLPLGRHLWGRTAPAIAAGLCWALWPPALGELAAGRLTQVVGLGLPVATLGLLRLAERPRPGDRWLTGAGVALTALGYWFYGIFVAILSPLFLWRAARPRARVGRDLLVAGAIAITIALPFAWPVLAPRLTGGWTGAPPLDARTLDPVFDNALRLTGEQPRQLQGWWPWVFAPGLALTMLWGQRRALWAALAGAATLFALGPATRLGEQALMLPYWALWRFVPFLDRLTHPGRWLVVAGLFLVILAVDGLARRRPWLTLTLPVGVLIQGYALGTLPLGSWRLELPEVWAEAARRGGGAIVVVPLLQAPLSCRYQPLLRRPLLGGMVEDKPWAWPPEWRAFVEGNRLLMDLWALGRGETRAVSVYQRDLDALRAAGFDTVLMDAERQARARGGAEALREALGAPLWEDPSGALWALPATGLSGDPPPSPWSLPEP